ncbi:MAG: hypothetical protein Q8R24_10155 [Legionellaceae bacterium]|nr:hypothetical protein [Legionellaceae bacterium]
MGQYFTKIAENELKKDLFNHPIDYIFKPFETTIDFLSTLISPVILPGYFCWLTLSTSTEALISIGYTWYFFIKNNETESRQYIVESNSSKNVGFQMLCILIIIAPVMIIVFLVRLITTLAMVIIKNIDQNEQKNSENSLPVITEAISRYATLVENVNADRNIITHTLMTHNLEVKAFITDKEQIQQTHEQAQQSIMRFSLFQATDEHIKLLREQNRNDELLGTFQELMQSYPRSALGMSSTPEDVELAYMAFEEHHNKVLDLVGIMFPNLFAFLNDAKQTSTPILSVMKV